MSAARARMPLFLAVCLFSGCKTATVHLYTLVPAPSLPSSYAAASPAHDQFVIERVLIPSAVDRKELVVRTSARELVLLENDNWAAPLREEVRHGLTTDLQLALAGQSSLAPIALQPMTAIWVDIRDWETTTHTVHLKAEWRLRRIEPASPLDIRCESDFTESDSGKADDLVRADQALLEDLAQSIARALRTSSPARCGV